MKNANLWKKALSFFLCLNLVTALVFAQHEEAKASPLALAPALAPIADIVTGVALGSGIVAGTAAGKSALDSIVQSVANKLKENEHKKFLESDEYTAENSPFRVVEGGKTRLPNKNDDPNNNTWYYLAGARGKMRNF